MESFTTALIQPYRRACGAAPENQDTIRKALGTTCEEYETTLLQRDMELQQVSLLNVVSNMCLTA